MSVEKKKTDHLKNAEKLTVKKLKMDVDDLDLGDADGSSNYSGMDNFESKAQKEKLPSEKGRIEEL